jgi:hypothetical protein
MNQPPSILLGIMDHTSARVLRPASRCLTPHLDALVVPRPGCRDYLLCAEADDRAGPLRHPACDAGIEFLRRQAAGERPFCCVVSTTEPHDPYVPPRSVLARYDVGAVPLSPTLRTGPVGPLLATGADDP